MKNSARAAGILGSKRFGRYYILAIIGTLAASCYPLYMGVRVVADMIADGTVMKENYPKYVIPYTPISLAVIVGLLLMPLFIRLLKRYALAGGAAAALGIFAALEALFEKRVVVTTSNTVARLEDWQMYMCAVPPDYLTPTGRTLTPVEILTGSYDPAFKLHFYLVSVVLILSILNSLYGFGQMAKTGKQKRRRALILQSGCAVSFLGLCILACFTAFWRDGRIIVSPLSASLMAVFFILLGVTVGVFVGSFLLGRSRAVSVGIPAAAALLTTLVMYIGEMILLSGSLYILGKGFFFRSIKGIVLSPADILIIAAAGGITAFVFLLLSELNDDTSN